MSAHLDEPLALLLGKAVEDAFAVFELLLVARHLRRQDALVVRQPVAAASQRAVTRHVLELQALLLLCKVVPAP